MAKKPAVKKVKELSYHDARELMLQKSVFIRRRSWPADDYLCFEQGRNYHVSDLRGMEEIFSVDFETADATDWEVIK